MYTRANTAIANEICIPQKQFSTFYISTEVHERVTICNVMIYFTCAYLGMNTQSSQTNLVFGVKYLFGVKHLPLSSVMYPKNLKNHMLMNKMPVGQQSINIL